MLEHFHEQANVQLTSLIANAGLSSGYQQEEFPYIPPGIIQTTFGTHNFECDGLVFDNTNVQHGIDFSSPMPDSPFTFQNTQIATYAGESMLAYGLGLASSNNTLTTGQEWMEPSGSYSSFSYASHVAPQDHSSNHQSAEFIPRTFGPEPPETDSDGFLEPHSHVFHSRPGVELPKTEKVKKRLNEQQRKEAQEVRNAGACWACHLSKQKVRSRLPEKLPSLIVDPSALLVAQASPASIAERWRAKGDL
jgi:hypothetical protein